MTIYLQIFHHRTFTNFLPSQAHICKGRAKINTYFGDVSFFCSNNWSIQINFLLWYLTTKTVKVSDWKYLTYYTSKLNQWYIQLKVDLITIPLITSLIKSPTMASSLKIPIPAMHFHIDLVTMDFIIYFIGPLKWFCIESYMNWFNNLFCSIPCDVWWCDLINVQLYIPVYSVSPLHLSKNKNIQPIAISFIASLLCDVHDCWLLTD